MKTMESTNNLRNSGNGRRSDRRYPVDLGISCRALSRHTDRTVGRRVVLGRIRDISSGGVRFTSSELLAPGTKVELSIDWPVLLDGACRLQLKGRGRVLRSDEHGIAIKIERHEFCTRKYQCQTVALGGAVGVGA
jgi:hypothetical protein